jgi:hypothetical protein
VGDGDRVGDGDGRMDGDRVVDGDGVGVARSALAVAPAAAR